MTLRHLRIFVAVCESGSMTGAAARLFIAQPSVSLAVAELEEHYGVKLFDRISRKLYLTDSGRQALAYARHITDLFDEMDQAVRDPDGVGRLRIGTSITIGSCLLPGYLKKLKKMYPSLKAEVVIGNSGAIEQQILENEIDLGIIEGTAHSSCIVSETFPGDHLVFICPPGHPFGGQTIEDLRLLSGEDFLLREKGSAGREIFDGLMAANELSVQPLWESTSNQAILGGVKQGLGVSVLPFFLVKESLERGEIEEFRLRGHRIQRQFSVIYHRNKFLPGSGRALVRVCLEGGVN